MSRSQSSAEPSQALWVPVVALAGLGIAVNLADNTSGWLSLFIYASAIAGARRPRREAVAAVAALTLLTVATGWIAQHPWPEIERTTFLVAVVGALVISLGLSWRHATRTEPGAIRRGAQPLGGDAPPIRTPDQRVRVFVSSTLEELAAEREAARAAITRLHLTPVLFELGARPHPPQSLYRSYLAQSDVFIGIYWQRYGWVAPDMDVSGLEDEYRLAADKPKLIYVKRPAPEREPRLGALLDRIRDDSLASYKPFATPAQLRRLIEDDLALILSERFASAAVPTRPGKSAPRESVDA